jgi:hypothetical protein
MIRSDIAKTVKHEEIGEDLAERRVKTMIERVFPIVPRIIIAGGIILNKILPFSASSNTSEEFCDAFNIATLFIVFPFKLLNFVSSCSF